MPVKIDGKKYYRTSEVCQIAGVSRSTLLRWLREGIFVEAIYRDRNGWRLFTQPEVDSLMREASRISRVSNYEQ